MASSDEFSFSDTSDESDEESCESSESGAIKDAVSEVMPMNLYQKLMNRERTGCFSGNSRQLHLPQLAYAKVPNRLRFCLKDIVPQCFLQGHMFMGLSACGQFLLSYKVCCNDSLAANHYSFNIGYKYTLYFWTFQPHQPLRSFYKCCLFDDHGVDNLKEVTITQWKGSDPRLLIIHGAAEDENEDSYITYVKVPKLGCLECKKLRDSEDEALFRAYALCLKCNLTIHTKYSTTESDRKFNPYTNLICPDRILIIANGFMHMLHIDLEIPPETDNTTTLSQILNPAVAQQHGQVRIATPQHDTASLNSDNISCDNQNNIVARIIADFSDIETDSVHSNSSSRNNEAHNEINNSTVSHKTYDELIFTCTGSSTNITQGEQSVSGSSVSTISHRGKRHHRIVTKSFRNGRNIAVDMQDASSTSSGLSPDKANAYEFSEDNEKCEKISTLRKRRLAEKKYEFSEDNSENIIPFTKIRLANRSGSGPTVLNMASPTPSSTHATHRNVVHRPSSVPTSYHHYVFNSPCASPSSSPHPSPPTTNVHRGSPIGLISPPCNSPVSASIRCSPSRQHVPTYSQRSPQPHVSPATQHMLSFKPLGALSPLQVSMTKRNMLEGSLSPNSNAPFLSPRRDEIRVTEVPIQIGLTEKPICTKKFKRRYVEEDNAASVITSEEGKVSFYFWGITMHSPRYDCISPGYHTSLPVEVHGSCYSEMQMISQTSYQQLRCASVVITQHSFDLETFIYYVISTLCQKHHKIYDVFYDWACELIHVCPLSYTVICLLMAQFSARDQLPSEPTKCLNCLRKLNCVFHRQHFECRILFTWNMESGECDVVDYGDLTASKSFELNSPIKRCGVATVTLAKTAKKLAQEMAISVKKVQDYSNNLRVLDSNINKSKRSLTDLDAAVEFFRKRRSGNND